MIDFPQQQDGHAGLSATDRCWGDVGVIPDPRSQPGISLRHLNPTSLWSIASALRKLLPTPPSHRIGVMAGVVNPGDQITTLACLQAAGVQLPGLPAS